LKLAWIRIFDMRSFELFASVVLMLAAVLIQGRDAMAERRLALVIGNSAYRTSPLANPANDAGLMSEMLARSGWQGQRGRNHACPSSP